jgi:hypothetical protein
MSLPVPLTLAATHDTNDAEVDWHCEAPVQERRMTEPTTTTSVRELIERLNREMDACLVRGDLMG